MKLIEDRVEKRSDQDTRLAAAAEIRWLRVEVERLRVRRDRWKRAAKANRQGWQHCDPEFWEDT